MRYKSAVLLDVFIGRLLLNFISLLPPYPKQLPPKANFKNLLVIKFLGVGSIIEATPLFCALKREYPNIPMDLLTFSENKQVAQSFGLFQNIYVIDFQEGAFNLFWRTIHLILVHRCKYSLVIDLEFFAGFSALVTKMIASTYSLGFESLFPRRNRCYSRTVIFDHSNHVRFIFLKFLGALYLKQPTDVSLTKLNISDKKKSSALEKLPELNNNHVHIAVNINSSDLCINRRWPEENFKKLIGLIQQDFASPQIYLVGGKEDVPIVKSFYESLPNKKGIYMVAGKLDILEFSYALSKMAYLITSDSGPLHIAEAMETPVVSFFGPETPNLYGPRSDRSLVFYQNLFCSPCLNTYNHKRSICRDNQCLKLISSDDVYQAMREGFNHK